MPGKKALVLDPKLVRLKLYFETRICTASISSQVCRSCFQLSLVRHYLFFFYSQVGPLGLIAEVPLLKEHGVDKIYQLLAEPLVTDLKNIVYLVRPNTEYMDMIATQV